MNTIEQIQQQEGALISVIRAATDALEQIGTHDLDDAVREFEEARKAALHRLDLAADAVRAGSARTVRDVGGVAADLAADLFGTPAGRTAEATPAADKQIPRAESPREEADRLSEFAGRMAETEATVAEELHARSTGHGLTETASELPLPPRITAIAQAALATKEEAEAPAPAAAPTTHRTNGKRKKQS